MNKGMKKAFLAVLLAGLAAGMITVEAGGPLYVTGVDATHPGQPYRWAINPVTYQTDRGGLGNQTNAQVNSLVAEAFQVWQDVGTSDISFQNSGQLDYDVTSNNIMVFANALGTCSDSQPANSIVYDIDGSIITALGMDNNSVLGFAGIICSDDTDGIYTHGWSVLNGRFIDGSPDTASHSSVTLAEFKTAFIHEFGHLIGLDHSQINLNCLTETSCSDDDLAGLPMMFPILLNETTATLKTDDEAALSVLYPAPSFETTTGRIQGRILFSDGQTPAQGYNVIARRVGDPRRTGVSCVSGFLFTAGAGNPLVPEGNDTEFFYGSREQSLIGYYDIPGLPPGDYTIEVEAINNSEEHPFVDGSSVGPIGNDLGFQYKLPGICDPQYLNNPSSSSDSCSAKSVVTVGAGTIVDAQTDVIFLGTPLRYDAWEDEP
jgi:hypothetical protein